MVAEHRNSTITVTIILDLSNCSKNVKYEIKRKCQEAGVTYLRLSTPTRFRITAFFVAIL